MARKQHCRDTIQVSYPYITPKKDNTIAPMEQIQRLATAVLYTEAYAKAMATTFPQSLQKYKTERSF